MVWAELLLASELLVGDLQLRDSGASAYSLLVLIRVLIFTVNVRATRVMSSVFRSQALAGWENVSTSTMSVSRSYRQVHFLLRAFAPSSRDCSGSTVTSRGSSDCTVT